VRVWSADPSDSVEKMPSSQQECQSGVQSLVYGWSAMVALEAQEIRPMTQESALHSEGTRSLAVGNRTEMAL
jgi:hypothetical protein